MANASRWWPTREEVLRRRHLMRRMMQLCEVDTATAACIDGGLAFHIAETKCRFCLQEAACRLWLDSDEGPRVPPDFCPNAGFFRLCQMSDKVQKH
jgi:Family of unknown function (DUF6455)